MSDLYTRVMETAEALKSRIDIKPQVGIILGTGLGELVQYVENQQIIEYQELEHIPEPTAIAHKGRFVFGELGGKDVMVMDGRFHRYEGYTLEQVTLPVRVFKAMGAQTMIVSNACGGMNPQYELGDLMIIEDHINLMGDNPLIGRNDDRLGPRIPDMSEPYDKKLIKLAQDLALAMGIRAQTGVYVAVTGPNLETRAEYRFLRAIGADVVGMSTVPEVIVAAHAGLRVLGMSIITDMCLPDALEAADIGKIIGIANEAEPKLTRLARSVVEKL